MENSKYPKYIFDWMGGLILFAGYIIGSMFVGVVGLAGKFIFKLDFMQKPWFMMFANAVVFCLMIAAFDFLMVRLKTGKKLNFNFSPTNFYTYLLIFPMMLGMMFVGEFITSQIPTTGPFFGDFYEFFENLMAGLTDDPVVMVITAVIMAPIFEEIIFRGIIQKGMINNGVKPWKAILLASVLFGVIHGNPWQFVGATLLGTVLGLVYYKTKSLLLPILLHGFNNLCSAILIFYTKKESFAEAFEMQEWMILAIGIGMFSIFFYLFTFRNKVRYSEI
ncbi:CPBP family intramembrane metalloprotease [Chryseobacterium sp. LC2016-29]|uniref:CPBP family intramembrane glutamic endopeptidase n=1 Tax=Chryseobacterium sp. LC2016-29 TaxID=2897331 RepID=UPI001E3D847F|nr:type II CAAX endopeptidase family protein [Chryseobacterium sp. LC2016-29]MCD0480583.1 CPBP family intramembrane metalloprotease [Chryseobacterium sp. LC2016-29]